MRRLLAPLFVMLIVLAALWMPAAAQTPEKHPAFVYGINAAVPGSYVGTFAPPGDAIYLLAGQVSVISPRITEIYPWAITNEVRADWHARNEPVPGTLEVFRHGALVAELTPMDYTIHFRQTEGATSAEIFLGKAATEAEADFRTRQEEFHRASEAYQEAERAWLDAAAEANRQQQESGDTGETVALPPAPEPPAPIGIFSNGLNEGIPIDLAPGEYQIRLRGPDGAIVPDSERELIIFAPRRTGVGYTVVPESRWTTPLESAAPGDVILGAPGEHLYLEPHLAREYPARAWALLQNPQRPAASAGDWEWVNGERLVEGTLEAVAGDGVERRELTPYQVTQMPGSQLGYEVHPLESDAEDTPDFAAFAIGLENAGEALEIRLVSPQGEVLAGSERQVRAAREAPLTRLFLLPLAPLAVGALVITRRGRRVRAPRDVEMTGTG